MKNSENKYGIYMKNPDFVIGSSTYKPDLKTSFASMDLSSADGKDFYEEVKPAKPANESKEDTS